MNKDSILLTIPSKPDYISLVRLTTSSIGYNKGLTVDEIEDIKVSIGEACINSLQLGGKEIISIEYETDDDKIVFKVSNCVETIPEEFYDNKERELGILIIKSLMDEVKFTDSGIEMTKFKE